MARKIIFIENKKDRAEREIKADRLEELRASGIYQNRLPLFDNADDYDFENNLQDYSLIIIHQSILTSQSLSIDFFDAVNRNNTKVIEFSGGLSQDMFLDDGYRLQLSDVSFYRIFNAYLDNIDNGHIIDFEDNYSLYNLYFGEKYKLAMLLNYRNMLWLTNVNEDVIDDKVIDNLDHLNHFVKENFPEIAGELYSEVDFSKIIKELV